jgi:hypothetical protein
VTKAQKVAALRSALAKYRGGKFVTGNSGGAGGMIFYVDRDGREFYIGGFNPGDAELIAKALTLTLELLSTRRG